MNLKWKSSIQGIMALTIQYESVGWAIKYKHCSNIREFHVHKNDKSRIKKLVERYRQG